VSLASWLCAPWRGQERSFSLKQKHQYLRAGKHRSFRQRMQSHHVLFACCTHAECTSCGWYATTEQRCRMMKTIADAKTVWTQASPPVCSSMLGPAAGAGAGVGCCQLAAHRAPRRSGNRDKKYRCTCARRCYHPPYLGRALPGPKATMTSDAELRVHGGAPSTGGRDLAVLSSSSISACLYAGQFPGWG
jgi:hypothetical protein